MVVFISILKLTLQTTNQWLIVGLNIKLTKAKIDLGSSHDILYSTIACKIKKEEENLRDRVQGMKKSHG